MNRNTQLIITILLAFSSAIYAGGVTVGNGQGKVLAGISLKKGFMSEGELTQEAQIIIDSIQNEQYLRVKKMQTQGECRSDYSLVKSLNIESFLPVKNGQLSLNREYIGYLQVELKDCKHINKIEADEPFGGPDFWDL